MVARSRPASVGALPDVFARPEPLRWHAALSASVASAAVLANVLWSPDRIWSPWLALALGVALAAHGWVVLARALRPAGPPGRLDVAPGPERPARTRDDRVDPGPPIFPAAPPRRWIPRRLDEPVPAPRVAAFPSPAPPPLPARWLEDVEIVPSRPAPFWPTWQPRLASAADDGWPADQALAGEPAGEPAPASAGW